MKQFQLEEPRKHCTKQVPHRTNQMCQDDESLLKHSRIKCTKQVPHRTNQMCQDDEILITILIIQEYKRVKSEPTIQSQSRLTSSTSIQLQALQLIFVDLLKILINKQKQQVFLFYFEMINTCRSQVRFGSMYVCTPWFSFSEHLTPSPPQGGGCSGKVGLGSYKFYDPNLFTTCFCKYINNKIKFYYSFIYYFLV